MLRPLLTIFGFVAGAALGAALALNLVSLLDRMGSINHGADGLSGFGLFLFIAALLALGGGVLGAIWTERRARVAGAGPAVIAVAVMAVGAVALYYFEHWRATGAIPEVETIENLPPESRNGA